MTVLTPLTRTQLLNFFDNDAINVINYFIKKTVFAQPEMREWQEIQAIQITKEHLEQWVVQALWIEWIWAWSYPVDVIDRNNHWAADVKMLHANIDENWLLTNEESWEASLWQKFRWAGVNLDQLFANQQYETIKNEWLDIYKEKNQLAINEQQLNNIYYFIFLRWWNFLYLVWMKVNLPELENVTVDYERTSDTSVFINNFIDDNLWNAKVYKSKKRLELRLRPWNWEHWNYWIKFNFASLLDNEHINLRDNVIEWENLNEYGIEKSRIIFNRNIRNN